MTRQILIYALLASACSVFQRTEMDASKRPILSSSWLGTRQLHCQRTGVVPAAHEKASIGYLVTDCFIILREEPLAGTDGRETCAKQHVVLSKHIVVAAMSRRCGAPRPRRRLFLACPDIPDVARSGLRIIRDQIASLPAPRCLYLRPRPWNGMDKVVQR